MEEGHIIHDSDSEEEENENSIWARNGEYKRFTQLENPARDIILQCLLSDKKHFSHEAVKTFGETLRKTLKVTYVPSTKVFIWKNVIRWTWVMKKSLEGTSDTDHAERLNFYLTDILAQYVNYKCETSFEKDDTEIANVTNEIYTTLWIILHPHIFYIVMTLLKVDVADNYCKILDPIFKKCLSNKDLSKHSDLIKYLGLILCFRHYKKLFKTKEEKEEINIIAAGKSLKQLKAENAVISLQLMSQGILPRSVPKIDKYNQCFASISGLVKFAAGKRNIGTRILLINESLDLDEAITKYFDQYKLHLNRNVEYSSWLKSGFFNQDRLTLDDDQQSTTTIDLTQSDSKNVSLKKLSTPSISSTSNGAANDLKQPNRDILIDKKKNDKSFNLRESSCKLNINSQNNLNNNQTDKNSQSNSDNIHPNSSIINSSSNNHHLFVEVNINVQGNVGVIRSNKNGNSFEISHVGNTYNCHPCNPNNCLECTNQYIGNSQNYTQYMGSNQGYPPHTYSNCDNQNNGLVNSTNFINKNNSIVSQYSDYEVVELIDSDDENSALYSREPLSLTSNKISTPTTFNSTLPSTSNLDHTRNVQKKQDNKSGSTIESSNSQNDLSSLSRNESTKLSTNISNFVTKSTNDKDENIRHPSSKISNLSQKSTDSFITKDLSQDTKDNDCILEVPNSEPSSTIHRLEYNLDRVTSMNKESSKKTHLQNSKQNIQFKSSLINDSSNTTDENVVSTTNPNEVKNIESTNPEVDWYCTKYSNMNNDCSKPHPYEKSSVQENVKTQEITSTDDSSFQSGKRSHQKEDTTSGIEGINLDKKKDGNNTLENHLRKNCKENSEKFEMSSKYSNYYYGTATSTTNKFFNQTKYEAFKRFTVEKSVVSDEHISNKNVQRNSLVKTTEDKIHEQNLLKQPKATGNRDLKNDNKNNAENNSLQVNFIEPKKYSVTKETRKNESSNEKSLEDINSTADDMTIVDDHEIKSNTLVQQDSNKNLLENISSTANDAAIVETFEEKSCNSPRALTESNQKRKSTDFIKAKLDKSHGDHETKSNTSVQQDNNKKSLENINNVTDDMAIEEKSCNSPRVSAESRQKQKSTELIKVKFDKSHGDRETKSNTSVQQDSNKKPLEGINNTASDTTIVQTFEDKSCNSLRAVIESNQKRKSTDFVKAKLDKNHGDCETKSNTSVQQDSNIKPLENISSTANDAAIVEIFEEKSCNSPRALTESNQKRKSTDFVKAKLDKTHGDRETKSNTSVQQNSNIKPLENISSTANDAAIVETFEEKSCNSPRALTESNQKRKSTDFVKAKLDKTHGDRETKSNTSVQQDNKKSLENINNVTDDMAIEEKSCNSPRVSTESRQKRKSTDFVKAKLDKSHGDRENKSNTSVQQDSNIKPLENISSTANDAAIVEIFEEKSCNSPRALTESNQKRKSTDFVKAKLDKSHGDRENKSNTSVQQDSNIKPLENISSTANDAAIVETFEEKSCNSPRALTESNQKRKSTDFVKAKLDKSHGDRENKSNTSVQQDSNIKPLENISSTANDAAIVEIFEEKSCNSPRALTESNQKRKSTDFVKAKLDKSHGDRENKSNTSVQQDSNIKPLENINSTANDVAIVETFEEKSCNSPRALTESNQKRKSTDFVKAKLDKSHGDRENKSNTSVQQDSNIKPLENISSTANDAAIVEIFEEKSCNSPRALTESNQKRKSTDFVKAKLDKSHGDRETKSNTSVQQDSNKKPLEGINNTASDTTIVQTFEDKSCNSLRAVIESNQKRKSTDFVKAKLDKNHGDCETKSNTSVQHDNNKKSLLNINNVADDIAIEEKSCNSPRVVTESNQKRKSTDFVKTKLDKTHGDRETKSNTSVQQDNKKSLENINNVADDMAIEEKSCNSPRVSTESRQKQKSTELIKVKFDKSHDDRETKSNTSVQQDNKKSLENINNVADDMAIEEKSCNSPRVSTESRQKQKSTELIKVKFDKSHDDRETKSNTSVQQDNKKSLENINNVADDMAIEEKSCNSPRVSTESRQKQKSTELIKVKFDKSHGDRETKGNTSVQQDSKKPLEGINNTASDTTIVQTFEDKSCNSLRALTESNQNRKSTDAVKAKFEKSDGDHENKSNTSVQSENNKKSLENISNTANDTAIVETCEENSCNLLPVSTVTRQKQKGTDFVKAKLNKPDDDHEIESHISVQEDNSESSFEDINKSANNTAIVKNLRENSCNPLRASTKSHQNENDINLVKEKLDKSDGDHETKSNISVQQNSNKTSLEDLNNTTDDMAMVETIKNNSYNPLCASTESRQKEKSADLVKEKLDKRDGHYETKSNTSVQHDSNKMPLEGMNNTAPDTTIVQTFEDKSCKSLRAESGENPKNIDYHKEKLNKYDGETKSDISVQQESDKRSLENINNTANDTAMVKTFEENLCNSLPASTESGQKEKSEDFVEEKLDKSDGDNDTKSKNSVQHNNNKKSLKDINIAANYTATVETIEDSVCNPLKASFDSNQGKHFVKDKLHKSQADNETESNISMQQESKTDASGHESKGNNQKLESTTSSSLNTNLNVTSGNKIVNQANFYRGQNEICYTNQTVTTSVDAKECRKEISLENDFKGKIADKKRKCFPQQKKITEEKKEESAEEQKEPKAEEETEASKKETSKKTFAETKEANKNTTVERKETNKTKLKNNISEEKIIIEKTREASKNSINERKESSKNTSEKTMESRKSLRQEKKEVTISVTKEKQKVCTDEATKIDDIPNRSQEKFTKTDSKSDNVIIKTNFDKKIVGNTKPARLDLAKSNSSSEKSDLISKEESTIGYKEISENVADTRSSFIENSEESKEKRVIDEHSAMNIDNVYPDTQEGKVFNRKNSLKSNNDDKVFNRKSYCKEPSEVPVNLIKSNKLGEFDLSKTTLDTQTNIHDRHKKELPSWNTKKLNFKSRIFNEIARDDNQNKLSTVNNLSKTHSTDEKQVLIKETPCNLKEPSEISSSVEYTTVIKDDVCHGINADPVLPKTNHQKLRNTKASRKMYSETIVETKDNKQSRHAENSSVSRAKDILPNQNDEIEFVKAYVNTEYKKESPYHRAKSVRFALNATEVKFDSYNKNDKESHNKEATEKTHQNIEKPISKLKSLKKILKEKSSLELLQNDSNETSAEKIVANTVQKDFVDHNAKIKNEPRRTEKDLSKANKVCSKELKLTDNQLIQSKKMNELEKSNSSKVNKNQSNVPSINEYNTRNTETTTAFLAKIDAVLNKEQEKDELKQPPEINEEVNQISYLKDLGLTEIEQTKCPKKNAKTTKKDDCIDEILTQNHFDIDSNKCSALDLLASVADREVSVKSKLPTINTYTNTRRLSKRKINSNQSSQRITRNNLTPQEKKSMEFFADLAKYIDQPIRKKKLKENADKLSKSQVQDSFPVKKSENEGENINEELTIATESTEGNTTKEKVDLLTTSNKQSAKSEDLVAKTPKESDNESKIEINNGEKKDRSLKIIFKNFNSNNAIIVNSTDLSSLEKKEETISSTETNQSNKRGRKLSKKKSPSETEEKETETQTSGEEDETDEDYNEENIKINEDLSYNKKDGKKSGKQIQFRLNNIFKKSVNKQRKQQKTILPKKSPIKFLKKSEKLNEKCTKDQNISNIIPETDVAKEVLAECNEKIEKTRSLKCVKKLQFEDFSNKEELVNKVKEINPSFESKSNSAKIRDNSQSLKIDEKLKPIDDLAKYPQDYTAGSNKEQHISKPIYVQPKISAEKTPICNTTPQNLKPDETKVVKLQSEIPIPFSPPNGIAQPPKKRRNSFFTESQYDGVQSTINKVSIPDVSQTPCLSLIPYEGGLSQVKTKIKKKSINAIVCELAAKRHNEENVPCSNKMSQSDSESKTETDKGDIFVEFDAQGNFQPFVQMNATNHATENIKPKPNDLENKISTDNYTKHHVLKRRRIQSINFDVQQSKQETTSIEEFAKTKELKTDRTNQEVVNNTDNVLLMSTTCNKEEPVSAVYTTISDNGICVASSLEEASKPDLFSEPLDMSLNSSVNSIHDESSPVCNSENYTITTELENKNSECVKSKRTLSYDKDLVLKSGVFETDSHKGHLASNLKQLVDSDIVPDSNVSNQISNLITENNSKIYDETIKLKAVSLELQKSSVVEFDCEPLTFTISTNEKSDDNQASDDKINNLRDEPPDIFKPQIISDDIDSTLIKLGLTTVESSIKNQHKLQENVNTITAKVNTDSTEEASSSGNFKINSEIVTADVTCKQQENFKIFSPNEGNPTPNYTDAEKPDTTINNNLQTDFNSSEPLLDSTHYFENMLVIPSANNSDRNINLSSSEVTSNLINDNNDATDIDISLDRMEDSSSICNDPHIDLISSTVEVETEQSNDFNLDETTPSVIVDKIVPEKINDLPKADDHQLISSQLFSHNIPEHLLSGDDADNYIFDNLPIADSSPKLHLDDKMKSDQRALNEPKVGKCAVELTCNEDLEEPQSKRIKPNLKLDDYLNSSVSSTTPTTNECKQSSNIISTNMINTQYDPDNQINDFDFLSIFDDHKYFETGLLGINGMSDVGINESHEWSDQINKSQINRGDALISGQCCDYIYPDNKNGAAPITTAESPESRSKQNSLLNDFISDEFLNDYNSRLSFDNFIGKEEIVLSTPLSQNIVNKSISSSDNNLHENDNKVDNFLKDLIEPSTSKTAYTITTTEQESSPVKTTLEFKKPLVPPEKPKIHLQNENHEPAVSTQQQYITPSNVHKQESFTPKYFHMPDLEDPVDIITPITPSIKPATSTVKRKSSNISGPLPVKKFYIKDSTYKKPLFAPPHRTVAEKSQDRCSNEKSQIVSYDETTFVRNKNQSVVKVVHLPQRTNP